MTTSPIPPPVFDHPVQHVRARQQRRWPKRVGIGAALVVALGAGIGIGAAASSQTSQLNAANQKLATAQSQLGSLRAQVSTLQGLYSSAKATARNATTIADQSASIAWTTRNAALNQRANALNAQAKTIAAEEGTLQANQISADGVYVVGHDLKAGIWHTNGDNGAGGNACYYATLNSTSTSDISDNNNFDGPETVNVNGAYAFQISGPCTWVKIG